MKRLFILDTTLRDGEQAPGINLRNEDKLAIALQLEKLGADIIETGFPATSVEQFQSCLSVCGSVKSSAVSVMARAVKSDILKALEALKAAAHPVIHITIPTSPIHRRYKLVKTPAGIIGMARQAVLIGKSTGAAVEIGAEDATRTEPEFLLRFYRSAIDSGASVINVPDTVGIMTPGKYGELIGYLAANIPEAADGRVRISAHCHNDIGLAAANTLAAITAGASQAEATVLGIGERAGNAPLEEIAAALFSLEEFSSNYSTLLKPEELIGTCQIVSACMGLPIPPGKAVAGTNAFAHSSGIHQNGFLKNPLTYEWMSPLSFGRLESEIPLDRNSGSSGLSYRLEKASGVKAPEALKEKIRKALRRLDGNPGTMTDTELVRLAGIKSKSGRPLLELKNIDIEQIDKDRFQATINILENGSRELFPIFTGNSPPEALIGALLHILPLGLSLNHYSCGCAGATGTCLFQAEVSLIVNGLILTGRGSGGTDYLKAIAEAFITAVNRFRLL